MIDQIGPALEKILNAAVASTLQEFDYQFQEEYQNTYHENWAMHEHEYSFEPKIKSKTSSFKGIRGEATGNLRSGLHHQKPSYSQSTATMSYYNKVPYAAIHEYGLMNTPSTGQVFVKRKLDMKPRWWNFSNLEPREMPEVAFTRIPFTHIAHKLDEMFWNEFVIAFKNSSNWGR